MHQDFGTYADGSQAGFVSVFLLCERSRRTSTRPCRAENCIAKIWLNPLRLAHSGDFGRAEIRRIEQIVADHREQFLEAWNDFFTD